MSVGQKYMDELDLGLTYTVNMDVLQNDFRINCKGKIGKPVFDIMIELCASFHYSKTPLGYFYNKIYKKNYYI